jgi:hypothetical protein|tara:strand:- start:5877 stop:6269 length:393 start_codon:yes stop_codon:yes gene_type:complete
MALLTDISARLDSQGRGTRGTDIFVARSPSSPDNVIVIYEFMGQEPYNTMGPSGTAPYVKRPRFQVVVRNTSYASAQTLADQVYSDLHWFKGTIGSTSYLLIRALNQPFSMGEDENKRAQLACNYRAWNA